MSSDRQAGDPSREAELRITDRADPRGAADPSVGEAGVEARPDRPDADPGEEAALVRVRGLPLLEALEARSPGSREHADAVASYAFATAVELGLSRRRAELVREAARLHEVGTLYVPAELVARSRSELLPRERAELDRHPELGSRLARGAGVPGPACESILAAGERFDGLGPRGSRGEELPIESRIIRAACEYDLAASAAAPTTRWRGEPRALALSQLREAAGTELDPTVVESLTRVVAHAAGTAGA